VCSFELLDLSNKVNSLQYLCFKGYVEEKINIRSSSGFLRRCMFCMFIYVFCILVNFINPNTIVMTAIE